MTNSERQLRQNIRNAYFCEDVEDILAAINQALLRGDKFSAKVLQELLNEAINELIETTK